MHLVVIDPQIDFCSKQGSLFVNGATEDMERLALFVDRVGHKLDDIHVTLDSHHLVHIANPIFWKDSHGDHPNPFTIITYKDVESGSWMATSPKFQRWALEYTKQLEISGKYSLMVYPVHCVIGSLGHAVFPDLFKSLTKWEEQFAVVNYVAKGSNIKTEHYSAIKAEVVDPSDPTTQINTNFIQILMDADQIIVAGECSSHCLRSSILDIADAFGDDKYIKKITLLTDATSPVQGFEKSADDFIKEMVARGMQLSTTDKFLR